MAADFGRYSISNNSEHLEEELLVRKELNQRSEKEMVVFHKS